MKTENHNEDSSGNEMLGPEVLAVREPTDEEDLNENLHPYLPKAPNLMKVLNLLLARYFWQSRQSFISASACSF